MRTNGVEDCSYAIPFKSPRQYLSAKINMLSSDFMIIPTTDEMEYLMTLKTEIAIDNAIRAIIFDRLDKMDDNSLYVHGVV